MQYTYTAVITEKDGTFYAKVPDVDGCITTAPTLAEAIALITDALNLCLVGLEDEELLRMSLHRSQRFLIYRQIFLRSFRQTL